MHSLLGKFATITAMIHMALGCAWHHGFAGSHECMKECPSALTDCVHGQQHHGHAHGHHTSGHTAGDLRDVQRDGNTLCTMCRKGNGQQPHSGCRDDGCTYIESHDFDFAAVVDFQEYLGGALTVALNDSSEFELDFFEILPVCTKFALHVRAHLFLCVQLL